MFVLVEGTFVQEADTLTIVQEDGKRYSIEGSLGPLVGDNVQLSLHHLPRLDHHWDTRGAGCCLWPEGQCPFGHDAKPQRFHSVVATGVLERDPWQVRAFDGTLTPLHFDWMVNHKGRLACASLSQLETLRGLVDGLKTQVSSVTMQDIESAAKDPCPR